MPLTALDLVAEAKQRIREIEPAEAEQICQSAVVLDVREPAEYAAGCLPGAVNIPRGVLEFRVDGHPELKDRRDSELLVYCQTGGRSALAVDTLHKLGYTKAVSLAGGFKAWQDSGRPVATPAA